MDKQRINQLVSQSINLRFRTVIFELNLGGIYEAGRLLSVRFSNTEITTYCNKIRDLLPMHISYTENKFLHQNILVNELTSKCIHIKGIKYVSR